jgi:hypothetical protein
MWINKVMSQVSHMGLLGNSSRSTNPATTPPASATASTSTTATSTTSAASDAMREILGQYDVTNITPRGFSEMLQKLNQELSLIRLDLEQEGIEPDQQVNLVDLYSKKLATFQEQLQALQKDSKTFASTQALEEPVRKRYEWLQKAATIHTSGGQGVNVTV